METYRVIFKRLDMDTFERFHFDWVLVPQQSDFAKAFISYLSPQTEARLDEHWEILYSDEAALYAVRKKGTGAPRS